MAHVLLQLIYPKRPKIMNADIQRLIVLILLVWLNFTAVVKSGLKMLAADLRLVESRLHSSLGICVTLTRITNKIVLSLNRSKWRPLVLNGVCLG